ncbi:hypothetical protein EA797_01455 [Stutzerimonas zhaodongensis]|uniref:Uncharacterized protein n=1 Tax=Stutzerimonas zhaodongensis TaxID=1176257 RepID=A0A3M2HUD7_9GAMM|nr:hypothetical protein EA797_01455 [Stutzerimonas zhaodongensis]
MLASNTCFLLESGERLVPAGDARCEALVLIASKLAPTGKVLCSVMPAIPSRCAQQRSLGDIGVADQGELMGALMAYFSAVSAV